MAFIREIKSTLYIIAGLYFTIGLIMLLAPLFVSNLICYLIGTLCLILGGLAIYIYLNSDLYKNFSTALLISAIALIVLGVFVIVDPKGFASLLPIVMGIILIMDAIVKFQSSQSLKKYQYQKWWVVMISSLMIFICGIFLMFNPFTAVTIFIRVLGFLLIIDALSCLLTANSYHNMEKENK